MSASTTNTPAGPPRLDGEQFERLFEGAGLAILSCDLTGALIAWNSLAERLFRDRRDCRTGVHLKTLLPECDHAPFDEHLHSVIRTLEPSEIRTTVQAGGHAVEYALWITPILENDGSIQSVTVWFHDITARLQYRRSVRKRERLNMLGMLSGSVAHHYNNLLCSIATSLEYALNMNTMSAMRRALQRTADAVSRAAALTQQLLAFAQADYRTFDMSDLTEMVLHYFDDHEETLRRTGIELTLNWSAGSMVALPRDQFKVVLSNLVENAREAMPQGGRLTVTLSSADGHAVLTIADSGAGIAAEHMERLFEPFFTTKGELVCGPCHKAGMGLAVAHGLVSEMGGTITVSNVPSGGACFEITLPTGLLESRLCDR